MGTTARQALVVVVPEYEHDPARALPCLRNDAARLQQSLQQSGYEVSVRGSDLKSLPSRNNVLIWLRGFFKAAKPGATLLVVLSGHGVHLNGRDYLLPQDVEKGMPGLADFLVAIGDVLASASTSPASDIVVFVDACREGFDESKSLGQFGGNPIKALNDDQVYELKRRRVTVLFACEPGEYAYFVSGDGGFSIFSHALADVLSLDHPAHSIAEVIKGTQERMDELADLHGKGRQKIHPKLEPGTDSEKANHRICDGEAPVVAQRAGWGGIVAGSSLWTRALGAKENPDRRDALRSAVATLADDAQKAVEAAATVLGADPWRDVDYAPRVIRRLTQLVADGGLVDFALGEAALLLAAPFVREHAYALAARALAAAQPTRLQVEIDTLDAAAAQARRRFEVTLLSHPHIVRRVRSLRAQRPAAGGTTDDDELALMSWLMHRHLARFAGMWLDEQGRGTLPEPTFRVTGEEGRTLNRARLLKLAKCVRSETERLTREDIPQPLVVATLEDGETLRERLLGTLLCLAGWMALDVRTAGDTLADHVGIADPILPARFVELLADAEWQGVASAQQLNVRCSHPAQDFAFHELVESANRILASTTRILIDLNQVGRLVDALPGQFSGDGIAAVDIDGRPAYITPHQHFTLAQTEVRELLMGEQLYGDPDLAIREVYQNALDACRYRLARSTFLERSGDRVSYEPRIVFRQGVSDGRPYIECDDNGVGMGFNEIEACFARAGKRFADLPDFIEEQELWMNCNPPVEMTPNSQFGVGVLSYFMIADEIDLTTCRMGRDGRLGPSVTVTVPGSGSLFRVRSGPVGKEAGTRLRLYLREGWAKSCCDVLEDVLVIAEFRTEAHDGPRKLVWEPGRPRLKALEGSVTSSLDTTPTADPDLWWVSELDQGQLLVDGLRVEPPWDVKYGEEPPLHGFLLNLRGGARPRLTVDRRKALNLSKAGIVGRAASQVDTLLGLSWLRFTWLWHVDPILADAASDFLGRNRVRLPIGYAEEFFSANERGIYRDELEMLRADPTMRDLALPISELGLKRSDSRALILAARSIAATDLSARLSVLNSFVSEHVAPSQTGDPAFDDVLNRQRFELAFQPPKYGVNPWERLAIYAALGVNMGAWLRERLPVVELQESAERLAQPLEALPAQDAQVRPVPSWLSRSMKRAGEAIGDWLERFSEGTQIAIVGGVIMLSSYGLLRAAEWGLRSAWQAYRSRHP